MTRARLFSASLPVISRIFSLMGLGKLPQLALSGGGFYQPPRWLIQTRNVSAKGFTAAQDPSVKSPEMCFLFSCL
jgi:hypothetical protein